MKLIDAKLEPWTDGKAHRIFVDEENCYDGWWRSNSDFQITYTCDKSLAPGSLRASIAEYIDYGLHAFVSSAQRVLSEDRYGFSTFDFYIDVIEFGKENTDVDPAYILNYLNEFARYLGAKFIRISKKESFPAFYEMISRFADKDLEECYIIDVKYPIEYEERAHVKLYDGDGITFKDILFLHSLGFAIDRDKCYIENGKDLFSIDRKSGAVSYPDFVTALGEEYLVFGEKVYHVAFYLSRGFEEARALTLTLGVKLDGIDYGFARLGNDKILAFHDVTTEENYFDILYKIKRLGDFKTCCVYTAFMPNGSIYYRGMSTHRNIDCELASSRLCLDVDGYTLYPPASKVAEDRAFNEELINTVFFGIAVSKNGKTVSKITVFPNDGKMLVSEGDEAEAHTYRIEREKVISILKNAHFCNWKYEYFKKSEGDVFAFGAVLKISDKTFTYRGTNDAPKILPYLISELISAKQ